MPSSSSSTTPSYYNSISHHIKRTLVFSICLICATFFINEFAIYYVTIWKCDWPAIEGSKQDNNLKVMFISDTHLLGQIKGHWFDKLRREWQMWRSFQTALFLFAPQVVFILGDIFDEGQWSTMSQFNQYVGRFHELFYVGNETRLHVVVGNHDIGFHYWTDDWLRRRFEKTFNVSTVDLIQIQDVNFVRINSIAMEGDKCHFCLEAERKLRSIGKKLKNGNYSRPIVLMHFPLYRESESVCQEIDSASEEEKKKKYRPKMDCLSKEATKMVLNVVHPRLVLSGHSHTSCVLTHDFDGHGDHVSEWTVASFSWRNNRLPSFLLSHISPSHHLISKCFLPNEFTVISIYLISAFTLICWLIYSIRIVLIKIKRD